MTDDRPELPPLAHEEARQRARDAGIPEVLAGPNVFRALLHHPPVAKIFTALVEAVVLDSVLDPRLRELAILRAAWVRGSTYEWASHYGVAQRLGMTDDDIASARGGATAPGLQPAERAVLELVDEVLDHGVAAADTLRVARDAVGSDEAYLELLTIAGCYPALAVVLEALEVPLDDGVGAWPPDGERPAPER
jgi:alkylhydroperoxidase family enzyme